MMNERAKSAVKSWLQSAVLERGRVPTPAGAERLLVVGSPLFHYGNAILAEPAIRLARRLAPRADIDLLATEAYAELIGPTGLVNHVITWRQVRAGGRICAGDFPYGRYDRVLTLCGHSWPGLSPLFVGLRTRLVLTESQRRNRLFTGEHETLESMRAVAASFAAGFREQDAWPSLHLREDERAAAGRLMALRVGSGTGPLVGLHAGSGKGQRWKRWSAEQFAALGRRLRAEAGARLAIFGGPDEAALNGRLAASIGTGAADLSNLAGFRVTAAAIQCCDAFVSNDSGLMHAANAAGVPLVAIFGPTSPQKNRPLGPPERIRLIRRTALACSPCYVRQGGEPGACAARPCLLGISVDEVFDAVMFMSGAQVEAA